MLLVLTVGLIGAGIALVRIVKQSQQYEIDGRLNARLAWLVSAIDMEAGDGKICMEAHGLPVGCLMIGRSEQKMVVYSGHRGILCK